MHFGLQIDITRAQANEPAIAELQQMHYRAGKPRALAGVWAAHVEGVLAGAMWVTYPVLNDSWRSMAWRDVPTVASRRAAWLNEHVRTIARVIVDPRFRACGVATALVRHYVRQPLTEKTEALAAMGAVSPFFVRAGMRELLIKHSRRDARLARELAACGMESWWLADMRRTERLLRASRRLQAAVVAWARASKATARHARTAQTSERVLVQLAMLAGASASAPVVVYVHETEQQTRSERQEGDRQWQRKAANL